MDNANNTFMLRRALTSAKYEKKTGNLHVLTSLNGSLKNAILVVKSGELIGCSYLDTIGKNAFRDLLQAVIVKTLFIQREISEFTPHQDMLSIGKFLAKVHSSQSAESVVQQPSHQSTPVVPPRSASYIRQATEFLGGVIGKDKARRQVQEIAKQHSPEHAIEEYLKRALISLHRPWAKLLQK